MGNFFYSVYLFFLKRKPIFFLGLILFFGILGWIAGAIEFEEDISGLIPTNTGNEKLQQVMETASFADKIIVNIHRGAEGTVEELTTYATRFIDTVNLVAGENIKYIQGQVEEDEAIETLDFVYEHLPFFLNKKDYNAIEDRIQPDSLYKITAANYNALTSPSGIMAKRTLGKDPLGISFMGLEKFKSLGVHDDFLLKDGFLLSKDENNLLLFITPEYGTGETGKNEALAVQLYEIKDALDRDFEEKVWCEYFGGALIAVANAKQIRKDIQFTVGIALILLLALFVFFYQRLITPLLLFLPTVLGGLLGISVLFFLRDHISAISLGIGSVLLGVTLDYSLHILTHIRNNELPQRIFSQVARPILMSSITTALAFLCLLFIKSRALQDLGIFAAVSVIGASVFSLIIIPLLYKGKQGKVSKSTFVDRIADYDFHKNKLIIGGILLLVLISVFTYTSVTFNKDISKLNYVPSHLQEAEENLDELTNATSKSLYITTYGNSTSEALEANDTVFEKLQQLDADKKVLSFTSIGALVTSEKKQRAQIEAWKQFWNPEKIQTTKAQLQEDADSFGFREDAFQKFFELMERDFNTVSFSEFETLPIMITEDFIRSKGQLTTVTSLVKVKKDGEKVIKEAFKEDANTFVIDRPEINEALLGSLKNDFNKLLGYCFIVILLLLTFFYRNWKLTLVTVLPILLTWFVTIGMMGLLKIEFNVFNVIISSFIFGLGVDYSIFVTNGLRREAGSGVNALTTHKTSILLSVFTTILGVGVLIFAKHPALYSISVVCVIGICVAMIIAFTIQPLLYNLLIFKSLKSNQN